MEILYKKIFSIGFYPLSFTKLEKILTQQNKVKEVWS